MLKPNDQSRNVLLLIELFGKLVAYIFIITKTLHLSHFIEYISVRKTDGLTCQQSKVLLEVRESLSLEKICIHIGLGWNQKGN